MSQTYRGPPPPPPALQVPPRHQYLSTPNSPSTESGEDNPIDRLDITLVPSKNASIEGRFEESTGRAMVYLDTEVIMKTRFSDYIGRSEAGYYLAKTIYVLAVDGLNSLQDTKDKEAGSFSLPPEEMLQKCKEESATYLKAAILHCGKMEHDTPAILWEKKETWALKKARMQVTLLHGKDCTIWKGKDPLTRKRLGFGELGFGGFISFSVRRGEEC